MVAMMLSIAVVAGEVTLRDPSAFSGRAKKIGLPDLRFWFVKVVNHKNHHQRTGSGS